MSKKLSLILPICIAVGACVVIAIVAYVSSGGQIALLSPAGTVATQQRDLLMIATLMMLLIVLPVFALTFYIAWKYRATNKKARYEPEWDGNTKLEALWWGFPLAIVAVLAVLAWTSTHNLEPARALNSDKKPLVVEVVALQWKWLFLYPEQQVASVNYVAFPADRPVTFKITSDAPMNSFWIPRLGGQIYAMSGMTTTLNLEADQPGSFHGTSANISGSGFASMNFTAEASTEQGFNSWVAEVKQQPQNLTFSSYIALARPKGLEKPIQYSAYDPGLYDSILAKYNDPSALGQIGGSAAASQSLQRILDAQ